MATKLLKTVRRELLAGDRATLIASLEAGDMLTFREKGRKTTYEVSLHQCYVLAMCQHMALEYQRKMEAYKAGRIRRKPKAPRFDVFSRSIRTALNTK